ncbi:hypothetical protein AMTRI_Chr11g152190 [Amborella trichopoda]
MALLSSLSLSKHLLMLVLLMEENEVHCKNSQPCDLSSHDYMSLTSLNLHGSLSFNETLRASKDFGGFRVRKPGAVVEPGSVQDIVDVIKVGLSSVSGLTVAARGNGHCTNGQAQAHRGVVLEMRGIKGIEVSLSRDNPYVEAGAGELWIDVLKATLKLGFAPVSWTDYLSLSIGGTLSQAGISGQAFRHGPQISTVLQMEIVTGKGEVITCSHTEEEDLFYGALGGLGQFGIITKARIAIQPAPQRTRWIRAIYEEFEEFKGDQEMLISMPSSSHHVFDYIEGFVVCIGDDPIDGWDTIPPNTMITHHTYGHHHASWNSSSSSTVRYCLELAINYNTSDSTHDIDKKMKAMVGSLRFSGGVVYSVDVSYLDFLSRVSYSEARARAIGTWDAPHPWLNILVPVSRIADFDRTIFKETVRLGVGGPILVYPLNSNKWSDRASAVVPDEEVFYLVAFLRFSLPFPLGFSVEAMHAQNQQIMEFCKQNGIGMKQYLPYYSKQSEWEDHFGNKWEEYRARKMRYDPMAILAPGQNIFPRIISRREEK